MKFVPGQLGDRVGEAGARVPGEPVAGGDHGPVRGHVPGGRGPFAAAAATLHAGRGPGHGVPVRVEDRELEAAGPHGAGDVLPSGVGRGRGLRRMQQSGSAKPRSELMTLKAHIIMNNVHFVRALKKRDTAM